MKTISWRWHDARTGMTLRTLLKTLHARWERSFERAIREVASGSGDDGKARGEFISTLIIDRGDAGRNGEGRTSRGKPRG